MKFTKFLAGIGIVCTLGVVGICSHLATDSTDYMYLIANQNSYNPSNAFVQNNEMNLRRSSVRKQQSPKEMETPHQAPELIYFS